MQVHKSLELLPEFKNAVITIGTFDGVHKGHLKIIDQLVETAKQINGESVLITFHPHPRKVIGNGDNLKVLNTLNEKINLLEQYSINHLVIVPFNRDFADMLPQDYIKDFLVKYFNPHTIIIGYDHRFGKNREGDFKLLEQMADTYKYYLKEIDELTLNNITISSTRIRESLFEGKIETAFEYLGYPYFFEGIIIHGDKKGRTIGFPTANIKIVRDDKLIPGNGVYAVRVRVSGYNKIMDGMMNIGVRPTVDGLKRMIEVHIFNFDADIYGETIQVKIFNRLRDEKKFSSLEELKNQLHTDKINAQNILNSNF